MKQLEKECRLSDKKLTAFWKGKCPDCEHSIEQYDFDEMYIEDGSYASRTRYKCDHCREIYEEYFTDEPGTDHYYVERSDDWEEEWIKLKEIVTDKTN